MMYKWTADMVRFMDDASKNSDYFEKVASFVTPYLKNCRTVCDAGCGLGQLSEALGRKNFKVTACDISKTAIEFIKKQNYINVEALECDFETWKPKEKFDAMIFHYFGSLDQIIEIAKRCCSGPVIVIKRDYKFHRFSFEKNPIKGHMAVTAEEYLTSRKIGFKKESFDLEFGQPFRSLEDALLFFETYSRDEDRSLINRENVMSKLIKSPIEGFEYYMPCRRQSIMFVLENI